MVVLALSIMLQRVVLFDDPLDVVPYICVSGLSGSSFAQITISNNLLKFTAETLASSGAWRAASTEEQRTLPSEGIILLRPLHTEVIPREPKLTSFNLVSVFDERDDAYTSLSPRVTSHGSLR